MAYRPGSLAQIEKHSHHGHWTPPGRETGHVRMCNMSYDCVVNTDLWTKILLVLCHERATKFIYWIFNKSTRGSKIHHPSQQPNTKLFLSSTTSTTSWRDHQFHKVSTILPRPVQEWQYILHSTGIPQSWLVTKIWETQKIVENVKKVASLNEGQPPQVVQLSESQNVVSTRKETQNNCYKQS